MQSNITTQENKSSMFNVFCCIHPDARMPVTVAMKNWVVLHPIYMAQPIRSFVQLMKKVGMQVNFIIPEPN